MIPFNGFTDSDFQVFEIPGFEARMPVIRAHITPKLKSLGDLLLPRLCEATGLKLYPHVAQHLRRTVNAPEETWVAFAKEKRAYKPFVHYRVAISADEIRVSVFVEDYADEKDAFAANLERNADALARHFARHPALRAYEICDDKGEPRRGRALDSATLRAFAQRTQRVKGQHAVFGIPFDKHQAAGWRGPALLEAVTQAAATLKPVYDCGPYDRTP